MSRFLCLLLISVFLSACASDSEVLKPAELTEYRARADIESAWKNNAGSAHPNRSQFFKPYLDSTIIYSVNRSGEVIATLVSDGREKWRKKYDKEFLAGVSGYGNALYVTTFDGSLLAISKEDGELLWSESFSAEALSPPATDGDTLVLHNNDGTILGLSADDGVELWRFSYQKPILTLHGYGRPLIVPGGVLIGLDDGSLVALTLADGKLIWQTQVSRAEGRSEIERLVDVDGEIVIDQQFIYAANYQGKIIQVEPAQGNIIWSRPMSSTSGVSVDEKQLYVTEPDGYVWALDKRTGSSMWKMEKLEGRRITRPVPYEDYLLVGDLDGYVHLLSKFDGSQIARIEVDSSPVVSEAIVSDEGVFVQSLGGVIHKLEITPRQ